MVMEEALDIINDECNRLIEKHKETIDKVDWDSSFWCTHDGKLIEAIEFICNNIDF